MFLKPHQWNMVPESRTERRLWLHQVRERTHTVMLHDKRYFDVDSGKFITDKLPTIHSLNLNDMMSRSQNYNDNAEDEFFDDYEHQKWFTPKDDDFDAEEEKKKANMEYALSRLAYENARQQLRQEDTLTDPSKTRIISWSSTRTNR